MIVSRGGGWQVAGAGAVLKMLLLASSVDAFFPTTTFHPLKAVVASNGVALCRPRGLAGKGAGFGGWGEAPGHSGVYSPRICSGTMLRQKNFDGDDDFESMDLTVTRSRSSSRSRSPSKSRSRSSSPRVDEGQGGGAEKWEEDLAALRVKASAGELPGPDMVAALRLCSAGAAVGGGVDDLWAIVASLESKV